MNVIINYSKAQIHNFWKIILVFSIKEFQWIIYFSTPSMTSCNETLASVCPSFGCYGNGYHGFHLPLLFFSTKLYPFPSPLSCKLMKQIRGGNSNWYQSSVTTTFLDNIIIATINVEFFRVTMILYRLIKWRWTSMKFKTWRIRWTVCRQWVVWFNFWFKWNATWVFAAAAKSHNNIENSLKNKKNARCWITIANHFEQKQNVVDLKTFLLGGKIWRTKSHRGHVIFLQILHQTIFHNA